MTVYNLGDEAITAAVTNIVITDGVSSAGVAQSFIDRLDCTAVTLTANFVYGAGGTTCVALVQTSLDGTNWIDIARFDFATSGLLKHCNISGLDDADVATAAGLTAQGRLRGILGDSLRCKLTTTGVYSGNTSISMRASVR